MVENAHITGADEARFDSSAGRSIASFRLPAGKEDTRELQIVEGVRTPIDASRVTAEFLGHAASLASVDPTQRRVLERAARELYLLEIRRGALPKRSAEIEEALADATRLESHVRALGSSSEEGRLAAQRLRQIEDRVVQLRQRVRALQAEIIVHETRAHEILAELGELKPLSVAPGAGQTADAG